MIKKALLYGGLGLAVFGVGMWYGRRHSPSALSAWEDDYAVVVPPKLLRAERQIAKALAGSWLADYRSAEDLSHFWKTPAYNSEAYAAGAYWTAVAARVLKSRGLAASAQALLTKGSVTYGVPGSRWLDGSVSDILHGAAQTIRAAAGTNRAALSVVKALETQATPGMVSNAQQITSDKSVVANTLVQTAKDVAQGGKSLATGSGLSWWTKLGIGAAVLLGLGIVFREPISAASQTIKRLLSSRDSTHGPKALPAPKEP